MNIKVSVVVPVYNTEKYLKKCLTSLVNQSLKEIEIIVVNDGTKDNSQKIIDNFAKKHSNIKSYIKENGGLSSARNYGIKKAKGEYIAFLDSDDYVEENMYELLYNKAKSENFDIAVCNINYIYDNYSKKAFSNLLSDIKLKQQVKESMINIYPAVWNKIYKKELFNNKIYFKEGIWYEDVEFLYRLYPYIDTIGVIDNYLVNYVQRDGAITKTFDMRVFNYIDNWNGILEYYKKNKKYDEYKKQLEYCYVRYLYATFINVASNFSDKELYKKAVLDAIENVKQNFPRYRRNKYFYRSFKGIYLLLFNKLLAKILYIKKHRK